jgi:hypothetical protein
MHVVLEDQNNTGQCIRNAYVEGVVILLPMVRSIAPTNSDTSISSLDAVNGVQSFWKLEQHRFFLW